jgi:hypothetical protein
MRCAPYLFKFFRFCLQIGQNLIGVDLNELKGTGITDLHTFRLSAAQVTLPCRLLRYEDPLIGTGLLTGAAGRAQFLIHQENGEVMVIPDGIHGTGLHTGVFSTLLTDEGNEEGPGFVLPKPDTGHSVGIETRLVP